MIISGYQGIGKSTLSTKDKIYIDLESSNFFINGQRPDNWHVLYCQVALSLSQQGYNVFVSSHKIVRDYLAQHSTERLVLVFPDKILKDKWINKLQERFVRTGSDKDFKALKNAEQFYDKNIDDLMSQEGFKKVVLLDLNYKLDQPLDLIRRGIYTSGLSFLVGD